MAEHYVYFIVQEQKRGNPPVKIGYSSDPDMRLMKLQTGCPNKLKIVARISCESESDGRKLERTLHWIAGKKFKRLEGEWFLIYGSFKKLLEDAIKASRVTPTAS